MAAVSVMPRFILAKYVPQLNRMEPRNIGVILWARGEIAARFLSPDDADFVADKSAYVWWLDSWRALAAQEAIAPLRGAPVVKSDAESMRAFLSHQEGQYLLVDAGELMDNIRKNQLQEAAEFLFSDLVALGAKSVAPERQRALLQQHTSELFVTSGLAARNDYHVDYEYTCAVYGSMKQMKFSHALGNGKPIAVFQEAAVRREQSVYSAALKLHSIAESAIVPKNRCAVLINGSEIDSEGSEENYELLSKVAQVIDVTKRDASDRLLEVALNGDRRARKATKQSKRT